MNDFFASEIGQLSGLVSSSQPPNASVFGRLDALVVAAGGDRTRLQQVEALREQFMASSY